MKKVTQLSDFFDFTKGFPKTYFYCGENKDYGATSCVSTAIRDSLNYDMYSTRMWDSVLLVNNLFSHPINKEQYLNE